MQPAGRVVVGYERVLDPFGLEHRGPEVFACTIELLAVRAGAVERRGASAASLQAHGVLPPAAHDGLDAVAGLADDTDASSAVILCTPRADRR